MPRKPLDDRSDSHAIGSPGVTKESPGDASRRVRGLGQSPSVNKISLLFNCSGS
jgi:hypothetical protein